MPKIGVRRKKRPGCKGSWGEQVDKGQEQDPLDSTSRILDAHVVGDCLLVSENGKPCSKNLPSEITVNNRAHTAIVASRRREEKF